VVSCRERWLAPGTNGMERRVPLNCILRQAVCGAAALAVVACGDEPPPPTVAQFLDNRILLEATMVRCAENRSESKYEAECVNAREAANRIAAEEAAQRRDELEAQSERKRQALRRAQEAAAEARRRAAEAERLRREAELLGQLPASAPAGDPADGGGQLPPPEAGGENAPAPASGQEATDLPPADAPDLDAVREELRRRQQDEDEPQ